MDEKRLVIRFIKAREVRAIPNSMRRVRSSHQPATKKSEEQPPGQTGGCFVQQMDQEGRCPLSIEKTLEGTDETKTEIGKAEGRIPVF